MKEYKCKDCGKTYYSASDIQNCPDCGGEMMEQGAYKRQVDELMREGYSRDRAIRIVNALVRG